MKFKNWIENWETNQINGEFWIYDGGSCSEDVSENGQGSHEGLVQQHYVQEIIDHFGVWEDEPDWEYGDIKDRIAKEILDSESEENRTELEELYEDSGPDELIEFILRRDDPEMVSKLFYANGYGDLRKHAIMELGWYRVAGNNIEAKSLTPHDMETIARGLESWGTELAGNTILGISVYGDQDYDVTLDELWAGKLNSDPEDEQQGFSVGQQPDVSQGWEQKRRQQQKWIDIQRDSASKQAKDMDLKDMHPYYQNKKFPFGDWNVNSFQNWVDLRESSEMGFRYTHYDGRGLMNNSSLNYDKLDDDEYSDVEDEYLSLQQPHRELHSQKIIFVFTQKGVQQHKRLIELLTKASKTGVRVEQVPISQYEVVWQSRDGQLGLKNKDWNENFDNDRKRGQNLLQSGYEYRSVVIYRAALPSDEILQGKNEYVTRSKKFAIEHAEHQAAVNEEPFVVFRYMAQSESVFEAYNPGEYFYGGKPIPGKVIYTAKIDH